MEFFTDNIYVFLRSNILRPTWAAITLSNTNKGFIFAEDLIAGAERDLQYRHSLTQYSRNATQYLI
jgi:hypothetical protein